MLSGFKIITVTHRNTNLKGIANFLVPADQAAAQPAILQKLKEQFALPEMLYLATCNRVLYLFYAPDVALPRFASDFLHEINPALSEEAIAKATLLEGQEAIQHLFEVAASIDSLVVGEREILRQLREAYDLSQSWGLTGDNLRLAIQSAVLAAKDVYANTRIGEKPVSIVSLAIEKMLESRLPKSARILLVGAGQTNNLVAKFLLKHGFQQVTVFNRTLEKAQALASSLHGQAKSLDELHSYADGFDCLIVCTAAQAPVITPEIYGQLNQEDTHEKTVIDLSIPHNVAPEVAERTDLRYIEIEGLRQLASHNLSFREREVEQARFLVDEHVNGFEMLIRQRRIERAMQQVPAEIKAVKSHAINTVFKKEFEQLDDQTRALFEKALTYMEKKCIGIPMKAAREHFLQ